MIYVWKLLHDQIDGEFPWIAVDSNSRVRGHSLKLVKKRMPTARHHMFSYRVVNSWNGLNDHVVTAPSMDAFKNRLDKLWSARVHDYPE